MRRKSFWTLGLVACLALAIAGFADHKPGHKKPGGGGGGGGKVSLIGTFRDLDGVVPVGEPDRILSDCRQGDMDPNACPYIDREGAVVTIDGHGHFNLNLKESRKHPVRKLFLDFTQCAEATCGTPPFSIGLVPNPSFMSTGGTPGNMAVGAVEPNEKLILVFTAPDPLNNNLDYKWKVRFQPDPAPNSAHPEACVGSSNIIVDHPDPDTWRFEGPHGVAGGAVACLESRLFSDATAPFVLRGNFFMPFMITATRKPK